MEQNDPHTPDRNSQSVGTSRDKENSHLDKRQIYRARETAQIGEEVGGRAYGNSAKKRRKRKEN